MRSLYDSASSASLFMRAPWDEVDVVWLDYGLEVRRLFADLVAGAFNTRGYRGVLFPTLIPAKLLHRQREHGRDIERISFALDQSGRLLKATSEVLFATLAVLERGAPAKYVQCTTVFRREQAARWRPLVRAQEIDPFIETMTFSAAADRTARTEVGVYEQLFRRLCLPVCVTERPQWDTFPEARRTIAFDSPIDDYGIAQVASVHDLGTSFARAFGIRNSSNRLLQQTSSGISGRALFATLAAHVWRGRFILPAAIAPVHAVADVSRKSLPRLRGLLSSCRVAAGVPDGIEPALRVAWSGTLLRVAAWNGDADTARPEHAGELAARLLLHADELLFARAQKKSPRSAIEEFASCESASCLARRVARQKVAVLGFVRGARPLRCCTCGSTTSALVRFGRTA